MANEVLLKQGTVVMFGLDGNQDVDIKLDSQADTEARESDAYDFGTTMATWYSLRVQVEFDIAPDADKTVDLYIAWSNDDAKWPGGATGADSEYMNGQEAEWIRNLKYVGSLITTNDTGPQIQIVGGFKPKARYGSLVFYNRTGEDTLDVGGVDSNFLWLIPMLNEVQ